LKFGPVNVVLNQAVFGECQVVVFLETGMLFRDEAVQTKTSNGDWGDRKSFTMGEFDAFRLLIGDRVFLVVRFVRAFSDIHQISIPVFARFDVFEYLPFIFGF